MKIFGFEITKARVQAPTAGEAKISNVYMFPWQHYQEEIQQPQNFTAQVNAFTSWVYVCASKNATAVASTPLRLYVKKKSKEQKLLVTTKDISRLQEVKLKAVPGLQKHFNKAPGGIQEVTEHPMITLIESVNPMINRFDLWELTELFLELTGNAYWYLPKNGLGIPSEIWIVPAQGMKIVPGQNNIIKGYVYSHGITKVPFDPDEIIHFKFPSPTSQLYGMSPLAAVANAYSFDRNIRKFEDTLMKNNARPEAILETQGVIGDREYDRLKEQWQMNYGGPAHVGKTIILEKGLTYKPITMSVKDINYLLGRKMAREEIAAAYGVPMSKLTTESVNLANARIGEWQYKKDTLEPRLRRIEEKLNEKLIPMFDENLFCAYDTPVPEDETFDLQEQNAHLSAYLTTINEERAKIGLDPVEWGDKPVAPANMVPLFSVQTDMLGGQMPPDKPGRPEKPEAGRADVIPPEGGSAEKPKPAAPAAPGKEKTVTDEDIQSFVDRVITALKKGTR